MSRNYKQFHKKRRVLWSLVVILVISLILLCGAFLMSHRSATTVYRPTTSVEPRGPSFEISTTTLRGRKLIDLNLTAIHPTITEHVAEVMAQSSKVFAYAHGTVAADGKLFIGMAANSANHFPSNELVVFGDASDISRPTLITMPASGEIETMTYDRTNDRVYIELSGNKALKIYAMNPHNYFMWTLASTSAIDAGRKPAIVSDGTYVYGITNTTPSTVFRVKIQGGELATSSIGHIRNGHSASIASFAGANVATTTELYFGGGMSDEFEKVDALTLASLGTVKISPCGMTDDMPYAPSTQGTFGYVYVGCEMVPYGIRIKTSDMSFERFVLPGGSLGMFAYGDDIYNAAEDGRIDIFPKGNLEQLHRYRIIDIKEPIDTKGQDLEVNEILYSPQNDGLYVTGWYGVEGLYRVSTSASDIQ